MDISEYSNIFVNKYHFKCKYTGLTYCTCINGTLNFYYSTDGEFKSMFEKILPSTNISTLLKLLSDCSYRKDDASIQAYKNIEKIVHYEREKYNQRYERELKKRCNNLQKDVSETLENTEISKNGYKLLSVASADTKCCINDCLNKEDYNNLFECSICHKCYHSTCCYPHINTKIKHSFPWSCAECSYCIVCKGDEERKHQVICNICNRYFHINCLNPKLLKVPKDFWICDDCLICSRCHQAIEFPIKNRDVDFEVIEDGFEYIDPKYGIRICFNCKNNQDDIICNVCNRELDKQGNRICSLCRLAVHNGCYKEQICSLCNQ